jgi:O-antigen/teichoic acid export membrane protein
MRQPIGNAFYGVLDYAAFPIGMLMVAPILLRRLGVVDYGVWTVAAAAVNTGAILASGFGDANIQHVATSRRSNDKDGLLAVVRAMMGIHLTLGLLIAWIVWLLSPMAAARVARGDALLQFDCLWSFRIVCALILIRALESVCISTQRGFERYGNAVRVSVVARLAGLLLAIPLSANKHPVVAIVAANALLALVSLCIQLRSLKLLCSGYSIFPALNVSVIRTLVEFGSFSWILALCAVVFNQVDRLILGVLLGPVVVASYALCTQIAQPLYGLAASSLHFLFPYLSNRRVGDISGSSRQAVWLALACNVGFVIASVPIVMKLGGPVLMHWAGPAVAQAAAPVFPMIVWSSALLGLNVTGTYTLMAMGRMRVVTLFTLAGGCLMLLMMWRLSGTLGLRAFAYARLVYGAISLLVYLPLLSCLLPRRSTFSASKSFQALEGEL